MLPQALKKNLLDYSEYKQQETLKLLLALQIPPEKSQPISEYLQNLVQCSFYDMVSNRIIGDLCSLIDLLLNARQGNSGIRGRVVLFVIESAVETLCGAQLERVLGTVVDGAGKLGWLDGVELNKLHRVVNQGLKGVQSGVLRGKLQCLLASIVGLAHKSGLQYWQPCLPSLPKITQQQYESNRFYRDSKIPYKLYLSYRQVYTTLNHRPKPSQSLSQKQRKLVLHKMSDTQTCIKHILDYFQLHPIPSSYPSSPSCPDTKLLPLPEHLIFSLNTKKFRSIFLLQILIFCKYYVEEDIGSLGLAEEDRVHLRALIVRIEGMAREGLWGLLGRVDGQRVLGVLGSFYENQIKWVQIKGGNKKSVIKFMSITNRMPVKSTMNVVVESASISELLNLSFSSMKQLGLTDENPPSKISQLRHQIQQQSIQKLAITNISATQNFLSEPSLIANRPKLSTKATTPSFEYYCFVTGGFREMEMEQEGHLEWRAMRCLMRERVGGVGLAAGRGKAEGQFQGSSDEEIYEDIPRKKLSYFEKQTTKKHRKPVNNETDTE